MPVFALKCPDCEHIFKGFVLEGAREPKEWVCSKCGSHEAKPIGRNSENHPLDTNHGKGCPCCG